MRSEQGRTSFALYFMNGRSSGLPLHLREPLRRYLEDHIETGGFLRCCLENDFERRAGISHAFHGALSHAGQDLTIGDLRGLALTIWRFPDAAWGSKEKVAAWIEAGKKTNDA